MKLPSTRILLQTFILLALLPQAQKAYGQSADWIGVMDGNLNNAANWSPASIPTQIATFNSSFPLGVNLNPFTTSPLTIESIHFPNNALGFSFSFNDANILTITGAGITGTTNTNPNVNGANALLSSITTPQILLTTGMNACSLGAANITLTNSGTINLEIGAYTNATSSQMSLSDPAIGATGLVSTNDLFSFTATNSGTISGKYQAAQMTLIGNSASLGNSATLNFTNTGLLNATTTPPGPPDRKFLGQFLIEDSSYLYPGSVSFQTGNDAHFTFLNDVGGTIQSADYSAQMVIVGSSGNVNINLGDRSDFSFINNGLLGDLFDIGQMQFVSYNNGSISFVTGDDAQFYFNNNGLIKGQTLTVGQLVFSYQDPSGPVLFQAGSNAHFTFINDVGGFLSRDLVPLSLNGVGQLLAFAPNGNSSPHTFIVGDSGVFDFINRNSITGNDNVAQLGLSGNGGDFSFATGDGVHFNFSNSGLIDGDWATGHVGLDGNGNLVSFTVGDDPVFIFDNQGQIHDSWQAGQLILNGDDGSAIFQAGNNGQFSFTNTGTVLGANYGSGQLTCISFGGLASYVVGNNTNLTFDNSGTIGGGGLNIGQIAIIGNQFTANVDIGENSQIDIINSAAGSIVGDYQNVGQIVVDGVGDAASLNLGSNSIMTATNYGLIQHIEFHAGQLVLDGDFGDVYLNLGNDVGMSFVNEQNGVIEAIISGQIVIDPDFGGISLTTGNNCSITVVNKGSISQAFSLPWLTGASAQVYFNGLFGSTDIITGDNFQLTAINEATGTISITDPMAFGPAQIYVYFTTIPATTAKTLTAINRQLVPDIEGIVFDNNCNAATTNIVLENTSLVVKTTNPLNIRSLTGDATSQVKLSEDLIFNTAGATTAFNGIITGGGNLTDSGFGTQILSGVQIDAPKTVTQAGPGVLAFSGPNNTWTGDLIISEGTVQVLSGATFGTGTIRFEQTLNPAILQIDATSNISRLIDITMNGGTLYAPTGQTVTVSGPMTGSAPFIKDGAGILNLATPISVMYNGPITAQAGTLAVNTSFPGDVYVDSGAILQGTGTIGGNVQINAGGTGSAGNSIGTINVIGNYTFNAGSTYLVELDPVSSDLTIASGQLTIAPNVNVQLSPAIGAYNSYQLYHIFQATAIDPLLNTFAGLINPYPLLQTEIIYRYPNPVLYDIFLGVAKLPFSTFNFCLDKNAQAVANYLSNGAPAPSGSDFSDLLQFLTFVLSCEELNADLLQLQPSLLKGLVLVQENNTMLMNQAVGLQQKSLYRSGCIRNAERKKWTLWADFWGDFMNQHKIQGEQGFHANTGGGLIGSSWQPFSDLSFGMAAGYSYSRVDWDHLTNSGSVQGIYGLLYTSWFNPHFYVNGIVTGAYNHYEEKRPIHLTSQGGRAQIHRHASADFNGGEAGVSCDMGGLFHVSNIDISPFGAVEYYILHQNGFKEHGADSLNLHVKASNADLLRASLGLNIARCYLWRAMKWIPTVQLAVIREQRFIASSYDAALQGNLADSFTVYGMKPCRTLAAPLVGCTAWMHEDRFALSLFYSGQFNGKYQDQQVNLQLQYCW